jgi:hypothetical protein
MRVATRVMMACIVLDRRVLERVDDHRRIELIGDHLEHTLRTLLDQRLDQLDGLVEQFGILRADVLGEDGLDARPGDAHDLEHQREDAAHREVGRHRDAGLAELREQPLEQRLAEVDGQVMKELLEALADTGHEGVGELLGIGGDAADHIAELVDQRPEAGRRDAQDAEQAVDDCLGGVLGELDERVGDVAE